MLTLKAPRRVHAPEDVRDAVRAILDDVAARGDAAVREATRRYDGVDRPDPRATPSEIRDAIASLPAEVHGALDWAAERIERFAGAQRAALQSLEIDMDPGVRVGHRLLPVQAAGCYVPGGRHPLPSTALMTVVPARVAAVPRIAAAAPPGPEGRIHPVTLAAMALAGAHEIYTMGGAQAVGALAYGTETIRRVDLIVGPGNRYVVEAKRQVFGGAGIDLLAGPTEICLIADGAADPLLLAADLLAQAEHEPHARAVLVGTDARVAEDALGEIDALLRDLPTAATARAAWEEFGEVAVCDALEEACARANALAPEHLGLHVADPDALIPLLTAYGALFIGSASAQVFGDYAAGPNHVLPTGGAARYTGGLWVGHFLRVTTFARLSPEGAARLASMAARLAEMEGLPAHARAALLRRGREGRT